MKTWSISETAKLFNLKESGFWKLVQERKLIPEPKIQEGRRKVYDIIGLKEVFFALKQAKEENRTKIGDINEIQKILKKIKI